MEKKLTADLNVVANSNLEIEYLNGDLNIIQKLDDEPNDVGGLTSAQLKAKFDEAGNTIKTYINDTLIPAILADDATEAAREAAEQERVTAEQGRVSAEEARVAAETARDSAETVRQSAETARSGAESTRQSKENARQTAETARANAETDRQAAETRRGEAETARASAESERRNAESGRVTAEGGRASAEASRVTAEQRRTFAESFRVQNEQKRVSAENSRVEAEAQRAAAEQARADENTGIVAQATAQANAAAQSAESASASAQTAQGAASSAGAAASTASSAAAAASGSASDAAGSAVAAAQSAASVAGINKTAESWAVGGTGTREGENTNNAKYWAQQAEATVGGDFATKTEAQGYVADHNQSATAHSDIREAVSEAGKAFVITGTVTDDEETGGYTVSGVTVTEAEIQAAIAAGKAVVAKLTYNNEIYELPLVYHDDQSQYHFGGNLGGLNLFFAISYTESGIGFRFSQILSASADSLMGLSVTVDNQNQILGTHIDDTNIHVTAEDKTAWNAKAEKPKAVPVKIQAGGWNSSTKKQTVPVSGVSADTTSQVVWVTFLTETALDAYMEAGIVPVAQGANSVTFRADTIPTETIPVIVVIQPVTFMA